MAVFGPADDRNPAGSDAERFGQQFDEGGVGLAFLRYRRDPDFQRRSASFGDNPVDAIGPAYRRQGNADN